MKENLIEKEKEDNTENTNLNKNTNNEHFIPCKSNNNPPKIKKSSCCSNFWGKIFPCCKRVDTINKRMIYLNFPELNVTNWSNKVENQKYNLLTFLPIVLFNQFKKFGNLFFLIMTLSQFIDELKVGFLFAYISPLSFVVFVSLVKELIDDINRRIQDKKINSTVVDLLVLSPDKKNVYKNKKMASDLLVGDIIELKKNSRVPADIIVLKTFNESDDNQSFIRTDQLDGETDWKLRKAPGLSQDISELELLSSEISIECEPPSKLIYNFEGVIRNVSDKNNIKTDPLNLENTMWSTTVVASQKVIGVIIYTGKETRARMNSSIPKIKVGILDEELNKSTIYLFFIMVILSAVITVAKGFYMTMFFTFFKYIVLFCAIIPISLRVNLDISKTYFSFAINRDSSIPQTIARNSTIPEELGRISYIFSDKTGTLTKNEMIFKKIAMETEQFGIESFDDLKIILSEECEVNDAPLLDIVNFQQKESEPNEIKEEEYPSSLGQETSLCSSSQKKSKRSLYTKRFKRPRTKIIRDTITAMVLCNNVTPVIDEDDPEKVNYQASSPDEVALVKFAESLKMRLINRTDKEIKIRDSKDNIEEYEILANFPFSSDTKRMGIILKNKKYGHIIYYLKGAENVMMQFVKKDYIGYIKENAENLAMKGLRTLVLSQKLLKQEEFDLWNKEYNEALTSMENRKLKISKVISKLENNMDFLCVTGVEDLLQDEVAITIDNLRNAGIKVWMLTGDKVETATCISISAGIKSKNQKIFTIKNDDFEHENTEKDVAKLKQLFKDYERKINIIPHIFIIDGDTLDLALKNCEEEFFKTTMNAPSVVCCRCSPTQKRIIVKTIKKYTGPKIRTAAVGDGGNDVAMIQEADVGIGIVGKEGLQASLAADYSIKEFRSLSILLLWWGRIAYKNTSTMSNFIIHRGLTISLNQFIFSFIFYFNPVALYNGFLSLGYSTIFTCLPSISILLDQDINKESVLKFPTLYKKLLKGKELNFKNFLWWLFKSIFQASVIMFGSILYLGDNLFLKILTVSFATLVYLELLNIYMEITTFHWFMAVSLISTTIVYSLTMFILKYYIDLYFIFKLDVFYKIILTAVIAWLPFYLLNRIKRCLFPKTVEKINDAEIDYANELKN